MATDGIDVLSMAYPKPGDVPVLRPPHDLSRFGVTDERAVHWLRTRLTPHPLRTMRERVPGDGASDTRVPRAYISCPLPGQPDRYRVFGERVREEGGAWHALAGGHDAMITMPEELSALLGNLVG